MRERGWTPDQYDALDIDELQLLLAAEMAAVVEAGGELPPAMRGEQR